MQIRKMVVSSVVGIGLGAAALAGGGTASATNDNWSPGDGKWQPGAGIATFSANVKVANGNLNGAFSPKVKVGDVKILSGNSFSILNGNKVLSGNSFLNGNLSGNILNTGANSFNTDNSKHVSVVKVWKYDSSTRTFVKVDINNSGNTTTTNNTTTNNGGCNTNDANNGHGNDCDGHDEGNPGNG